MAAMKAVFRLNDGAEVSLNPGEAVDFLMAGSWLAGVGHSAPCLGRSFIEVQS
jgi:hypothetical protein